MKHLPYIIAGLLMFIAGLLMLALLVSDPSLIPYAVGGCITGILLAGFVKK